MSAGDYPVVMCDDDSGCLEWALDHTLHGLGRLVGSSTQLPEGWTGDAPGSGMDRQFCPAHALVAEPAVDTCPVCGGRGVWMDQPCECAGADQ